jgi:hypothetical protein
MRIRIVGRKRDEEVMNRKKEAGKMGQRKVELPRVYCRYLYIEREKTGQKSRFLAVV